MTITICGGGGLGTVCAGVFLQQGHVVNLLTGHPDRWVADIEVSDLKGQVFSGHLNKITSDASEVIGDSDIILCCVPGYLIRQTLDKIKPYLRAGQVVGSIVSSTGFFFQAHEVLPHEITLFGFQRVPFIARCAVYGQSAKLLGYKSNLKAVIENCDHPDDLRKKLENLFLTPIELLSDYLEVSLTNSNPILHTGRLYTLWHAYDGEIREDLLKFYAEWDDESSEMLIAMDKEFMALTSKLGISPEVIPSLLEYYESSDAASLTKKIKSIPAFHDIPAPMNKVQGGWVPNFGSRYFTEDFPYGLHYIYELGLKHNIDMPNIAKVYEWGISVMNT